MFLTGACSITLGRISLRWLDGPFSHALEISKRDPFHQKLQPLVRDWRQVLVGEKDGEGVATLHFQYTDFHCFYTLSYIGGYGVPSSAKRAGT
jgi:hypothetical protein